jgi:hypothetical protein
MLRRVIAVGARRRVVEETAGRCPYAREDRVTMLKWLKLNPPKKITFVVAALVAIVAVVLWVVGKVVTNPPDIAVEGAPIAAIVAWAVLAAGNTLKGF